MPVPAHIERLIERFDQLHTRYRRGDYGETQTRQHNTALQRQIDATGQRIDTLVYEPYGLTNDEIAIVEGRA